MSVGDRKENHPWTLSCRATFCTLTSPPPLIYLNRGFNTEGPYPYGASLTFTQSYKLSKVQPFGYFFYLFHSKTLLMNLYQDFTTYWRTFLSAVTVVYKTNMAISHFGSRPQTNCWMPYCRLGQVKFRNATHDKNRPRRANDRRLRVLFFYLKQ